MVLKLVYFTKSSRDWRVNEGCKGLSEEIHSFFLCHNNNNVVRDHLVNNLC